MSDSPRLVADISSLKSGGKHILSNGLQRAIDLWIVGRRLSHAEKRSNDRNFDKKDMIMTGLNERPLKYL
jgi:hypothetical protein